MATYNSFSLKHTQVDASDNFAIDLGSTNQILTSFKASAQDTSVLGLQLIVENSVDSGGTGALLQLGYTDSTALIRPDIFNIVTRDRYIFLPYQYLYITTATTVGEDTYLYLTTTELSSTQNILSDLQKIVVTKTTSGTSQILGSPGSGFKYNVKSVYVYQSLYAVNDCYLLVDDIPVSKDIDISTSVSTLMNNTDITIDETQTLNLNCLNAISTVYVTITYTVIPA